MLHLPKVLFSNQKSPRYRALIEESSQRFGDRYCELWFSPLKESIACGHIVKGGSGDVTFLGQPHLRLTGGRQLRLLPRSLSSLAQSTKCLEIPSMDFLASGLQLSLLDRERHQQMRGWRKGKWRYLFPWIFPCGVTKGWLHPSIKVLAPFR